MFHRQDAKSAKEYENARKGFLCAVLHPAAKILRGEHGFALEIVVLGLTAPGGMAIEVEF